MAPKLENMAFPSMDLPVFANWHKFLLANAKLQAHATKAMLRYQIEGVTFLRHRYEEDLKLIDELVASDEFNDAFKVMSGFMKTAMSDYSAEVDKVAAMGSRLASDTAKGIRKVTEDLDTKSAA